MADSNGPTTRDLNLIDLWITIWKKRVFLMIFSALGLTVGVGLGFLLPETFQSKSVFIPVSSGGNSGGLSQYAGLAALAGVNLPASGVIDNTKKISALLLSRTIREKVIDNLDLVPFLVPDTNQKHNEKRLAADTLDKMVKLTTGKNGEFELSVEAKNPELAQKIASQYVIELELALNKSNLDLSRKDMETTERQLKEQSQRLKTAQEAMAQFQTKNKIIDPSSQVKGYSELFTELFSQKIQLEIKIKQMEAAYNSTDSRLLAAKSQIESIDKKISEIQNNQTNLGGISFRDAPEQLIEYQNLLRDLEIATKVYGGLVASLEQNRIANSPEKVYVEIIDPPQVPDVRYGPNRLLLILICGLGAFFLSFISIFVQNGISNLRRDFKKKASLAQ